MSNNAFKAEPDFGRIVDFYGGSVTANMAAGIMPAFGYTDPVHVVGQDWIFWRVLYVSTDAAPTEVTFQPEALDLLDPLDAAALWSPLPYEPATTATGLVEFFDYQPFRQLWTVATARIVRTPAFEGWMRLGIATDAAADTETLFSVRAMRQRVGGPKAN